VNFKQYDIVEPQYLVDISAVAACFQEWGHHPLSYLVNRLKPKANSQQILLGNFAGTALDDIIHHPETTFADTLRTSFRQQALQFCTLPDFDARQFKADAQQQVNNIREAVEVLFRNHDRSRALLEPSFLCPALGLQGRVDLMTDDMRLLVEQKSGKNRMHISHYVQLLLYYGVLYYNFSFQSSPDIRLLYSKYPAADGVLATSFNEQLFCEAIDVRNRIVQMELDIARHGFGSIMPILKSATLLENPRNEAFFNTYKRHETDSVLQPLHNLSGKERDYVERMFTFVYREQAAQKLAGEEAEILTGHYQAPLSTPQSPLSTILRLSVSNAEATDFRRGDMVWLYRFEGQPDKEHSILYKGVISELTADHVTVRLNNPIPTPHTPHTFAIEHASSDVVTTGCLRGIHAFTTAPQDRRDLLLGLRTPRCDTSVSLSRSYHPHYDDIVLRAMQARDYFLLQGPPGTGKTSMALRFLVEEELCRSNAAPTSVLLTAFTNRAVDEICDMLETTGHDYLRIGNEASCDPRFVHRLLEKRLDALPTMDAIRQMITAMPIVVATTTTLQSQSSLLQLKHFSLLIADEASQLLEPSVIGLLSSPQIDRFILIGDHKQLPAVVAQPDDEPRLRDCRRSLFERLWLHECGQRCTAFLGVLNHQGRMHPDIARFPNTMFYQREQIECVPLPHQTEQSLDYRQPSEDSLDDMLKTRRVIFLPAKDADDEARIVADLLRRIHRYTADHFDADRTIGVIVPYRCQIAAIRQETARLGVDALQDISIDTVERYQGSQRDVIIYSFTAQQPEDLEFLTANTIDETDDAHPSSAHVIDRKLNVVMTRARQQLIMTGNVSLLRQNAIFRELIDSYR
jgi:hypothetical protein